MLYQSKNSFSFEGIIPINKPKGATSFSLVGALRRLTRVRTIGHAGTLDPFATGVMVLLVGKNYTRLSNDFLTQDKEYEARIKLGIATDTYDCVGVPVFTSDQVPSEEEVRSAIAAFQGEIEQVPPMFSAKKINGKKLYELARQGKEIERQPVKVTVKTTLISYEYPYVDIKIACSKGTYIRSIADDIGKRLGCGAHVETLVRTRSGSIHLSECLDGELLSSPEMTLSQLEGFVQTRKH